MGWELGAAGQWGWAQPQPERREQGPAQGDGCAEVELDKF